jgi:hypothetical protein
VKRQRNEVRRPPRSRRAGRFVWSAAPSQGETNCKAPRNGVKLICGATFPARAVAPVGNVGEIHRGKPDGAAIALPQSPGVPVEFSGATQDERGPPKAYRSRIFPLLKSDGLISGFAGNSDSPVDNRFPTPLSCSVCYGCVNTLHFCTALPLMIG